MRTAIFALILCGATSALCQSAPPASPSPFEFKSNPLPLPRNWSFSQPLPNAQLKQRIIALRGVLVLPAAGPMRHWDDAQIDPEIITHPAQSKLGVQPQGTQVAQNEFPNLQLLPIQSHSPKLQLAPSQWPNFAVKMIPVQWPKFKLVPVDGGTPETPTPPAK